MEWGRLPGAALISGTALFAVGAAFHFLSPFVFTQVEQAYRNEALFRPWVGWTRVYMVIHPWLYGVLFAGAFLAMRATAGAANVGGMRDGLCYGLAVFLIGSLPVFALNFASFQVSAGLVACWGLQSLCQYSLGGLVLGWYIGRPAM